jgi:hypothetical protein
VIYGGEWDYCHEPGSKKTLGSILASFGLQMIVHIDRMHPIERTIHHLQDASPKIIRKDTIQQENGSVKKTMGNEWLGDPYVGHKEEEGFSRSSDDRHMDNP